MTAGILATSASLAAAVVALALCAGAAALSSRLFQPRVVGEMFVGILIGVFLSWARHWPSLPLSLGSFQSTLYWISEPALLVYLFCLGYETNLERFNNALSRSLPIALASLIVPFVLTYCLLASHWSLGLGPITTPLGILTVCGAMAVTAFPVLSRILTETNLFSTELGTTALSAAAVDDLFAWSLLAVLAGIMSHANFTSDALSHGAIAVVCALGVVLLWGQLRRSGGRRVTVVRLAVLLAAAYAFGRIVGIDPILIAFAVGLGTPRSDVIWNVIRSLQGMATFIMPLFFVLAGSYMDIRASVPLTAVAIWLLWASVTKGGAVYVAALINGFERGNAVVAAVLMNCRGAVSLIFLSIGLRSGLISAFSYSILVSVTLATTLLTKPIITLMARRDA